MGKKNTVCLSLAWILTSKYQSIVDDRMKIKHILCGKYIWRIRSELLQCPAMKINKIASWMSLKSTKIKKNIPELAVLYWNLLFAHPPAAKHTFHRSSDQWTDGVNWLWRFSFVLKLQSLLDVLVEKTKKMNYFLRNFVRRERMFPWFNINPNPSVLWGVSRIRLWPRSPSGSCSGGWTWTSRWALR